MDAKEHYFVARLKVEPRLRTGWIDREGMPGKPVRELAVQAVSGR